MKIIQIAADKQLGYWYFDKQERQILAAIGAYLTRRGLYIETRNMWLFVGGQCCSILYICNNPNPEIC